MSERDRPLGQWRIYWHKVRKKFQVCIQLPGRPQEHIGLFSSLVNARIARNDYLNQHLGPGALAWVFQARKGRKKQALSPLSPPGEEESLPEGEEEVREQRLEPRTRQELRRILFGEDESHE